MWIAGRGFIVPFYQLWHLALFGHGRVTVIQLARVSHTVPTLEDRAMTNGTRLAAADKSPPARGGSWRISQVARTTTPQRNAGQVLMSAIEAKADIDWTSSDEKKNHFSTNRRKSHDAHYGAVRYECSAEPVMTFNFHCRDCQRPFCGVRYRRAGPPFLWERAGDPM